MLPSSYQIVLEQISPGFGTDTAGIGDRFYREAGQGFLCKTRESHGILATNFLTVFSKLLKQQPSGLLPILKGEPWEQMRASKRNGCHNETAKPETL